MSPRTQVYLLGFFLMLMGLGLMFYKSEMLSMPIKPGKYATVWTVEAKVGFIADGGAVKASLALPKNQNNMEIIEELFSSSGYGFNITSAANHKRAEWAKRVASGKQTLYYKLDVYKHESGESLPSLEINKVHPKPNWRGSRLEALRDSAQALISNSWQASSDRDTFVIQLLKNLSDKSNNNARLIHNNLPDKNDVAIALDLLAMAEVPAHIIRGIYLHEDRNRMSAEALIEIFNGEQWQVFAPATGQKGLPDNFLVWQRGDRSLLDVEGGRRSSVKFSVLANDVPARKVALAQMGSEQAALLDYSIYSLPIEQQSVFKFILLVPVGALIVIFLRVVVGIRTAGTFMPVLLAIAFIQTQLLNGVLIFLMILAIGLFVRSYLSRLDLLLVSRIAAVVVIVVCLMSFISITSYKLGIEQALTITFFPMIIIAWTIEHMSILWEDDGPVEVLIQTGGSLLVATLCYLAMTNTYIEHWMFNFPELLFTLLGMIVILGHYTGYRMSELIRFRYMGQA